MELDLWEINIKKKTQPLKPKRYFSVNFKLQSLGEIQ